MKKLIATLLVLCSFSVSAEWVLVKSNAENDKTFFDPKTIGIYEKYRKVWVLVNFATPTQLGADNAMSKSTYYKFDCKDSRYAVVAELFSSEPGGGGKVLKNVSESEDKWMSASKGSTLHSALELVCAK